MTIAPRLLRLPVMTGVVTALACTTLAIGTTVSAQQSVRVIEGRVTLTGALPPNPLAEMALPPPSVERGDPEVRNVVVFLRHPAVRGASRPAGEIRQEEEEFAPHVIAVTAGAQVSFPNGDGLFHNVFSPTPKTTFDLGKYRRGETRTQLFAEPGIVKVFCRIHSYMSAVVRVFDHPYYAVPDADGRFRMPAPAPGTYDLVVWHERGSEESSRVSVTARGATVALSYPRSGS